MDSQTSHLNQALLNLALGNHHSVLFHLSQEPPSFLTQLTQASVNLTLGRYELAINLLNEQQPLASGAQVPQLHFVRGRALFLSGHFEKAAQDFAKARESLSQISEELERKDLERQVDLFERKVQIEASKSHSLGNVNDTAFLPSSAAPKQTSAPISAQPSEESKQEPVKVAAAAEASAQPVATQKTVPLIDPKYDFYQNATHVYLSFKVANPSVSEQTEVTFEPELVTLRFAEGGVEQVLQLSQPIIPDQSTKNASAKKIEIKLKKVVDNATWMRIEKDGQTKLMATTTAIPSQVTIPSYPTSSKQKKDWSKVDKQIEKDLAQEKPEGDQALNSLFKQIYERADEDTRRAMIKSYQTSGGTVLSTNWGEVASKDYEGRDRPDPPQGQQWAKDEI